jgi:adenylate kinase family enzyme
MAKKIRTYIEKGDLIPDDLINAIFEEDILPKAQQEGRACLLIDGFPRRESQIPDWGEAVPRLILFFDCPKDVCCTRVCNRNLNRPLDTSEKFEQRYKQFERDNPSIIDKYSTLKGKAVPYEEMFEVMHGRRVNVGKLVKVDTNATGDVSYERLQNELEHSAEWTAMVKEIEDNFPTIVPDEPKWSHMGFD